jgi:hypothetical protein
MLAYEMLKDSGVIPQRNTVQPLAGKLRDQTTPETEESAVKRIAVALVEGAIERHRFFGLPLPEVEEAEAAILAEKEIRSGRAK